MGKRRRPHIKCPGGRKKSVPTSGFAYHNPDCDYFGNTDESRQALVGYGTHNHIQHSKCESCRKIYTLSAVIIMLN